MNACLSAWWKQILLNCVVPECNLEASMTFSHSKTNSTAQIQGDEILVEKAHWDRELWEVGKSVSRKNEDAKGLLCL